jgi:hypothetical protein
MVNKLKTSFPILVDFHLPEGPTRDTNSPLFTVKLTFLGDTTLAIEETYNLDRFSTFQCGF